MEGITVKDLRNTICLVMPDLRSLSRTTMGAIQIDKRFKMTLDSGRSAGSRS